MLTIKDENFEGTFPFRPHYHVVHGCAMHFVDEGSGEPLVLLHGDRPGGISIGTLFPPCPGGIAVSSPIIWAWENQTFRRTLRSTAWSSPLLISKPSCYTWICQAIALVVHDWGGPCRPGICHAPSRTDQTTGPSEHLGLCSLAWRFVSRLLELIRSPPRRSVCSAEEWLS